MSSIETGSWQYNLELVNTLACCRDVRCRHGMWSSQHPAQLCVHFLLPGCPSSQPFLDIEQDSVSSEMVNKICCPGDIFLTNI